MIRIQRKDCPGCLNKPDNEFVKNDCKREEVKTTLLSMQHGKCCFCERKISDLSATEREVEHYVPRSAFKDGNRKIQWRLANKWENLLYSCRSCNSSKGWQLPFNSTTNEREIIDPSCADDDPEDHIGFIVDDNLIYFAAQNNSRLGKSTIEKLGFQGRGDLFGELRRIRLNIEQTIMELVNAYMSNDVATVTSKTRELSRTTSAHHPFASFKRKYIWKRVQQLNSESGRFEAMYGKPLGPIEVHINTGYDIEN